MKDMNYYSTSTVPYPERPVKPFQPDRLTHAYIDAYEKYELDMIEYRKQLDAYNAEIGRLREEFKHDALDEFGLLNHPKADKIFAYAWEQGHSAGYSEVYNYLSELSDLF